MNNIFEIIVVALVLSVAAVFFAWLFCSMLYMFFIEDKVNAKREAKARKLYPEYFSLQRIRQDHIEASSKYFRRKRNIQENIDNILKEKPYIPNATLASIEELLEGLRNDYQELKRKEEAEDSIIEQLTEEMKAIWKDNELLMKLYSFD